MHRAVVLDLGVVLNGEVLLVLDDGVETVAKEGEVVVQRGTVHMWHNQAEGIMKVLFVLVLAEKVVVGSGGGKEKVLDATRYEIN